MDYGSIVYVTPDDVWRNAAVVTDHRGPTRPGSSWRVPTTAIVNTAPPAGTVGTVTTMTPATLAQTAYPYQYPVPGVQPQPTWMAGGWWNPAQPPYVAPPVGAPSNLATILGGFGDLGSLANILAQVFAALLPLPAAPTPQDANDSDASVNAAVNSSNLIRYQQALATFARRDQQILTVGSVLKELFKRPGFLG